MTEHFARQFFSSHHPLLSSMAFEFIQTTTDTVIVEICASEKFMVETNRIHSGFATLVLDTVMGGVVLGSLTVPQPIATVNLTTKHLGDIFPEQWLTCTGTLILTRNDVAIVHGSIAPKDQKDNPVAIAHGSFMIGTRSTPAGSN